MQILTQLTELWQKLDQRARMTIVVVAVLCLGGLFALMRVQSAVAYAPLYSGLSAEDAGQIVEKLKAVKVPHRLTNGGACIEVPQEQVYEQRIALAKEGLPASGQVGFEIFDKSSLPGTEFSNRVNYQRALQGELARTISAMEEVRSARVHLVLPEESLFEQKTKASASVVLQSRPGAELTPDLTAAVAHIVASAVQEIKPDEVTVVDTSGRVLRGAGMDGLAGGLSAGQFEVQQQYQTRLCTNLQSMLDSVLGPNQSVVRVQAQLDFDSEETKSENIIPVAGGKGLISSEKTRQEQYQGGGPNAGGNAGVQPNLGLGATAGAGGRSGQYVNRDETKQYEYSRNTSSLVKAPGKVKKLTVAAVISDGLDSSAEQQVRDVLSAAGGISTDRGDVITVQRMKIDAAEAAKKTDKDLAAVEGGRRRQGLLQTLLRGLLTVGAAALIYMSVVVAARQVREATAAASVETVAGETLEAGAAFAPAAAATVTSQLNPAMRDQLRQIASQDREVVAEGIRTLLHEEVGRR